MEHQLTLPDGVTLAVAEEGAGFPVVGLHGLTATRRYVLMGSRMLERAGHRVILYDARGHGASSPAPSPSQYTYGALALDLRGVLDGLHIEHAVLVGASMGAQTIVRFALDHPDRVAGVALITPAFDPRHFPAGLERWDALSQGLRTGGIEGFLSAYKTEHLPPAVRETVVGVIRQRLSAHAHPAAVADALAALPRSAPFESLSELASITVPAVIVGSRDAFDPEHPLAVAQAYAAAIPNAELLVEDEGRSPLAWQGGQLSRILAALAGRSGSATI